MTATGVAILSQNTDYKRVQRVNGLLQSALGGSTQALQQLLYDAYEKRTGLPGDDRVRDGKHSPKVVRDLAVSRLRQYVAAKGGLPEQFAAYVGRLNTVVIPSQKLKEAVQAVPRAPSVPPSPADDTRPQEAVTAMQPWGSPPPILIDSAGGGGGSFPAASYSSQPSPAAAAGGGAAGGGMVVDEQPVVGGAGSSAAMSPLVIGGILAAVAAVVLLNKPGRR